MSPTADQILYDNMGNILSLDELQGLGATTPAQANALNKAAAIGGEKALSQAANGLFDREGRTLLANLRNLSPSDAVKLNAGDRKVRGFPFFRRQAIADLDNGNILLSSDLIVNGEGNIQNRQLQTGWNALIVALGIRFGINGVVVAGDIPVYFNNSSDPQAAVYTNGFASPNLFPGIVIPPYFANAELDVFINDSLETTFLVSELLTQTSESTGQKNNFVELKQYIFLEAQTSVNFKLRFPQGVAAPTTAVIYDVNGEPVSTNATWNVELAVKTMALIPRGK